MRKPDWQTDDGSIRLYNADCLSLRDEFPKDAAIVSDPPYGMGWNTNHKRFTGGAGGQVRREWDSVYDDDKPFDPSHWLDFRRVVLWGCNHFAACLPAGTTLVWLKRYDTGFGTFLSDAELAWMKGGCGVYCHRDVSLQGESENRCHPTQKPVGLMEWCIEFAKSSGELVADPYMGSGTTGVASVRLGCSFIGCEIDPTHFATAVRRIEAELNRHPLFDEPKPKQLELLTA